MSDDAELFGALRRMWTARDPMPEGLVDDVLVALATGDLAEEYARLTLVAESTELVGVRGGDARTLEFRDGDLVVLVRVSDTGAGAVRLDGWVSPSGAGSAFLETATVDVTAEVSVDGRFEFASVPRGPAELRIRLDPPLNAGLETDGFVL